MDADCGQSNGSATLGTVTGGTPPYTYSFNGGAFGTVTAFTGLASGSYPVLVKDNNGCTFTTTANVNNTGGPTAIGITTVDANCGQSNGSVTLGAVAGGVPGYTYSFNGGAFGTVTAFTGLAAGSYAVAVKDINGCTFNTTATVVSTGNVTAPIVGTVTQPTCALATGSVVLSGLPAGNWTINPGAITGNTATATISGLAGGVTYNFTVTNAAGCVSPASANVTIAAAASTPTAPIVGAITQPTCTTPTGSVVLSGLPAGNWTINPGGIAGNTATTTISGLAPGLTYNFTVTNATGCTSPASANVAINPAPAAPTAIVVNPLNASCGQNNGSVTLGTVTGGVPPYTYSFNGGAFDVTTSFTGLAVGTYSVIVKDNNGCTFSTSANIANTGGPTAIVINPVNADCGQSDGSVTLGTVTGGAAPYTYSFNGGEQIRN